MGQAANVQALTKYVIGLKVGDVKGMEEVLHEGFKLYVPDNGTLVGKGAAEIGEYLKPFQHSPRSNAGKAHEAIFEFDHAVIAPTGEDMWMEFETILGGVTGARRVQVADGKVLADWIYLN